MSSLSRHAVWLQPSRASLLIQSDVSKGSGIQNKIRFPDPATNWAIGKTLLLRLFVTWWLGDRLKFPMNMDATVYASRRKKKKQAHTWLVNICKKRKILECFWQGRLYICFVRGRLFLSSVWVWIVSSYYLKKDYLMHLGLISIWIGVNLFCSAQYHIQISPPIIQFHPHPEKKKDEIRISLCCPALCWLIPSQTIFWIQYQSVYSQLLNGQKCYWTTGDIFLILSNSGTEIHPRALIHFEIAAPHVLFTAPATLNS